MANAELRDRVALVTGASSGIGRETAVLLAQHGAVVGLLGRNVEALQQVEREIAAAGGSSMILQADVTSDHDRQAAVERLVDRYGRMDILVNAAGIYRGGTLQDTRKEDWQAIMQVNVDAVFGMMQTCLPYLENSRGCIVNVSSIAGLRAFAGILAYAVSKAAVDQITRCAALELAPKGIRVNAVNPGVVVTELHRRGGMDEAVYAQFLEHSKTTHPLGRVGTPRDVAAAILYLVSPQADWVTGVTLSVDGGRQLTCAR